MRTHKLLLTALSASVAAAGLALAPPAHASEYVISGVPYWDYSPDAGIVFFCYATVNRDPMIQFDTTPPTDTGAQLIIDDCSVRKNDVVILSSSQPAVTGPAAATTPVNAKFELAGTVSCLAAHAFLSSGERINTSVCYANS